MLGSYGGSIKSMSIVSPPTPPMMALSTSVPPCARLLMPSTASRRTSGLEDHRARSIRGRMMVPSSLSRWKDDFLRREGKKDGRRLKTARNVTQSPTPPLPFPLTYLDLDQCCRPPFASWWYSGELGARPPLLPLLYPGAGSMSSSSWCWWLCQAWRCLLLAGRRTQTYYTRVYVA